MTVHVWLRSVVLADLSRWLPLHRLLAFYTPSKTQNAWSKLTADEIISHIDRHLQNCHRMRGRRCLRRGLLVFYFLRLAGHPAKLHFSYFLEQHGKTQTHCWNSVGNRVDSPPEQSSVELLVWDGAE